MLGIPLHTVGKKYFNPRSREGSDCGDGSEGRSGQYFNPRSREGSDQCGCEQSN